MPLTASPLREIPRTTSGISATESAKFSARRDELAEAALTTIAELGYARASLREIAKNSAFSHGVLHYYFADKGDLIVHCVRHYKKLCVARYDDILAVATTSDELLERFGAKLVETLKEDTGMHRLWYDLRTQSMFDPALQTDVLAIDKSLEKMIWQVAVQYSKLADAPLILDSEATYEIFDGVFNHALVDYVAGKRGVPARLIRHVNLLLPQLITR